MVPLIALVGRPNVGKSTLFNALTRRRDALVANFPGLTRDRQYGHGVVGESPYRLIDTGGLTGSGESIDALMERQALQAVEEADAVLFLVDGREGVSAADEAIAKVLRQFGKPLWLVVNKTDRVDTEVALVEFYQLGLGEPIPIAAVHNRGVRSLMTQVLQHEALQLESGEARDDPEGGIKVAVVGRPNVGKSTLINRILGELRVVVFDMPGTTRDTIYIPFERDGQHYTLIDTAGVRRRARVKQTVEKFSVIKTLQAIDDAHVVVMLLDAHESISEQDAHLLGYVLEAGRALVVAVNKWDGLESDARQQIRDQLTLKLPFLSFAKCHFISALHGSGVGDLFGSICQAYNAALRDLATPRLTELLQSFVAAHPPPLVNGRRIKLRYAHQGGRNPPVIVIHGNQTAALPESYRRYLENSYREALHLQGTPVSIELKQGENPYANKPNRLTPRQQRTRQRLVQHIKKSDKRRKGR
ncbi:ribosome biogenesis GTPase Der [Ectothiorhodospiraceae bacterium BW-2]|nr:ribosome biogenesis GTPase Der [Ectothiorhodospiraceae bacterium BW-2]